MKASPGFAGGAGRPLPPVQSGPAVITGLSGSGWTGYFHDQNGQPRLFQMIEDWGFPANAGRYNGGAGVDADINNYTSVRGGQKFTAMYTSPYGNTELGGAYDDGRTWDGIYPFQVNGTPGEITSSGQTVTLNDPFWQRIDYLLTQLAANGITMFMSLGMNMTFAGIYASAGAAQCTAIAAALAARYASQPNIIWMVGDDSPPGAWDTLETAFLTGLRNAGDTRPISIEMYQESTSLRSLDGTTAMTWGIDNAQFNWYYGFEPTYFGVEYCYTEAADFSVPQLPALAGDTGWAADGTDDTLLVTQMWWALSSGARGFGCLGNTWNWPSNSESLLTGVVFIDTYMQTIRALFESFTNWHNLVPDTASAFITAGRGTRWTYNGSPTEGDLTADSYVTGSITAAGDLAVIYFSHHATITIDQSKLTGGYTATWYDPASGAATSTATGSTYNSTAQGTNSAGDPSWVLVLR